MEVEVEVEVEVITVVSSSESDRVGVTANKMKGEEEMYVQRQEVRREGG